LGTRAVFPGGAGDQLVEGAQSWQRPHLGAGAATLGLGETCTTVTVSSPKKGMAKLQKA